MRLFIAIDIDEDIKKRIGEMVEKLRTFAKDAKWVRSENLHLTLKFLGEVKDGVRVERIKRVLHEIATRTIPFSIHLSGTGFFPDEKRPRVFWIGVKESDELLRLFMEIDKELSSIGFSPEKRDFSGHITIARFRDYRDRDELMEVISTYKDIDFGSIDVREVVLMESILSTQGVIYRRIGNFLFSERRKG